MVGGGERIRDGDGTPQPKPLKCEVCGKILIPTGIKKVKGGKTYEKYACPDGDFFSKKTGEK